MEVINNLQLIFRKAIEFVSTGMQSPGSKSSVFEVG